MSSGPFGHCLRDLSERSLFADYVDLLGCAEIVFTTGDTHVVQNGKRLSFSDYEIVVYLPGSYDAFLEEPFGLRATTRLERRSAAQLALAFEEAVERRANLGRWKLLGNTPSTGRLASNRLSLVQRSATRHSAGRMSGSASALCDALATLDPSDWVLKFASDTHVRGRSGAYLPMRLSDPRVALSKAGRLPCSIERHIAGPADYRVYVMGLMATCVTWRRIPALLDARAQSVLDARVALGPIAKTAMEAALGLCQQFGLRFAAVDFVDDISGMLYEVDINPHGSWAWLGESASKEIDAKFLSYIAQQLLQ